MNKKPFCCLSQTKVFEDVNDEVGFASSYHVFLVVKQKFKRSQVTEKKVLQYILRTGRQSIEIELREKS
jgi:hypothetical protein